MPTMAAAVPEHRSHPGLAPLRVAHCSTWNIRGHGISNDGASGEAQVSERAGPPAHVSRGTLSVGASRVVSLTSDLGLLGSHEDEPAERVGYGDWFPPIPVQVLADLWEIVRANPEDDLFGGQRVSVAPFEKLGIFT